MADGNSLLDPQAYAVHTQKKLFNSTPKQNGTGDAVGSSSSLIVVGLGRAVSSYHKWRNLQARTVLRGSPPDREFGPLEPV